MSPTIFYILYFFLCHFVLSFIECTIFIEFINLEQTILNILLIINIPIAIIITKHKYKKDEIREIEEYEMEIHEEAIRQIDIEKEIERIKNNK